jgi:hypothetical protein
MTTAVKYKSNTLTRIVDENSSLSLLFGGSLRATTRFPTDTLPILPIARAIINSNLLENVNIPDCLDSHNGSLADSHLEKRRRRLARVIEVPSPIPMPFRRYQSEWMTFSHLGFVQQSVYTIILVVYRPKLPDILVEDVSLLESGQSPYSNSFLRVVNKFNQTHCKSRARYPAIAFALCITEIARSVAFGNANRGVFLVFEVAGIEYIPVADVDLVVPFVHRPSKRAIC